MLPMQEVQIQTLARELKVPHAMWCGENIFSKLRNHFCNSPFLRLPSPQSGASGKKNLSS